MIVVAPSAVESLSEDRKGGRGKCKYCGEMVNNVSFHEAQECPETKQPWVDTGHGKVLGPPPWYVKKLEALRKLPPPTLEEVRQQWEASAKWNDEYGFECVEKIKKSDYIR